MTPPIEQLSSITLKGKKGQSSVAGFWLPHAMLWGVRIFRFVQISQLGCTSHLSNMPSQSSKTLKCFYHMIYLFIFQS